MIIIVFHTPGLWLRVNRVPGRERLEGKDSGALILSLVRLGHGRSGGQTVTRAVRAARAREGFDPRQASGSAQGSVVRNGRGLFNPRDGRKAI